MRALSKQPGARFPCVEDFAQALQEASQHHIERSPIISPPDQRRAPQEPHLTASDQATEFSQGEEDPSLPPVQPLTPVSTKADQPGSIETEAPTQEVPSSSMTASAEVPPSPRTVTPTLVSFPTRKMRVPNRRMLFTLLLVFLVTLSGVGISSFFTGRLLGSGGLGRYTSA